ncbi:UDP-N-acetylmuramoyl-tripeptide--D-alanyl-D-alanine ligase [Falsarthrobacter nasiphocae]|uniref:UDP-N-acetylmuramoyl-tripeptide--D-alanyl-D-alanine ligase n=1 Tax=Falsarthrobacter nasiphocae TaxID=189863 RepID=A0AAE4C5Q5_9MICC|nr:UDP-N-acetylmuramoyl-tripeptide--D-alanyl-D-alanine ligase [Falsarthrobacter nasiphocae]MDR6891322.1 UDP-N-acetylmuramoyl-tripeptide--D-alanyl-D-alanine ligase [Falsarthrobacter nasiphocae]
MLSITAGQIADATQGRLVGSVARELAITGATTDSRLVEPGFMYIAKPGEHADGHDFAAAAVEAGAVLVLGEREVEANGATLPGVVVEDAVLAMGAVARAVVSLLRERGDVKIAGITGSAGKTTTKDLAAGILRGIGDTVSPIGSYNGEVGVPLTIFGAEAETRFMVLEMGANGVGNIEYLTSIAKPDVGVVLGVGSAHAGEFGGVANIARTKGEMVEALEPGDTAVLNADDPLVWAMRTRTRAGVLALTSDDALTDEEIRAQHPGARVLRATAVESRAGGCPSFDLVTPDGERGRVESQLIGAHHIVNLLAAAAIALSFGVPLADVVASLSEQKAASRWRMERTDRPDGVTVINDAYNANPESMRAALRALADMAEGRRTWAVLGGMLELGDASIEEHDAIGRYAVRLDISKVVAVGPLARPLWNGAVMEGSWGDEAVHVADLDEAQALLEDQLRPGDLVLFKSSRDSRLRELGDRIAWLTGANETTRDQQGAQTP